MAEVRALAGRIGAGHKIATFLFPSHGGEAFAEGLVLTDDELAGCIAASEQRRPSAFGRVEGRRERPCPTDPLCAAGRSTFAVSPGGDVRACLMLSEVHGNVRETALADIWRSEGMVALRRTTSEARRGCRDCDDAEFCFPCPGLAEKETGDLLGKAPTACREARLRHGLARASGVARENATAPPREGCVEP